MSIDAPMLYRLHKPDEIRARQECAFSYYSLYTNFVTTRPLYNPHNWYAIETYRRVLPTFEGRDIVAILRQNARQSREAARRTGSPAKVTSITDVGYGVGRALLQMAKIGGDMFSLTAYGAQEPTQKPFVLKDEHKLYRNQPTRHLSKQESVLLKVMS